MPQKPPSPDLLDRLGETALACKDLIREMHAAEKDLKATIKEAQQVGVVLAAVITDTIKTNLDEAATREIAALGEQTKQAMSASCEKIRREFDSYAEPLMATFDDMAVGRDSLERQFIMIAERMNEIQASYEDNVRQTSEELATKVIGEVRAEIQRILVEHGLA